MLWICVFDCCRMARWDATGSGVHGRSATRSAIRWNAVSTLGTWTTAARCSVVGRGVIIATITTRPGIPWRHGSSAESSRPNEPPSSCPASWKRSRPVFLSVVIGYEISRRFREKSKIRIASNRAVRSWLSLLLHLLGLISLILTSLERKVEKSRGRGEDLLRTEFRVAYNSCRLDQRSGIRESCLGFTSDTQCPGIRWSDNEAVKFNLREDRSLTRLSGQRQGIRDLLRRRSGSSNLSYDVRRRFLSNETCSSHSYRSIQFINMPDKNCKKDASLSIRIKRKRRSFEALYSAAI